MATLALTHLLLVKVPHLVGSNDAIRVQVNESEPVGKAHGVGLVLLRHEKAWEKDNVEHMSEGGAPRRVRGWAKGGDIQTKSS